MARKSKKERDYEVLWSRPDHSKHELVAGTFSAKGDEKAGVIFARDYENN